MICLGAFGLLFDSVVVFDIPSGPDSPYLIARVAYTYASTTDPLLLAAPVWVRICLGLSLFVYVPFYFTAAAALVRGWEWIRVSAIMVCTLVCTFTGVLFAGVALFGEPHLRSPDPLGWVAANGAYVLFPGWLLVRMLPPRPLSR